MPNPNESLNKAPKAKTIIEPKPTDQTPGENSRDDDNDTAITPLGQVIHPSEMTDRDWDNLEFDHAYQREDFEAQYR